jgi:hypothetical protein
MDDWDHENLLRETITALKQFRTTDHVEGTIHARHVDDLIDGLHDLLARADHLKRSML